jgi:hypothetical protein
MEEIIRNFNLIMQEMETEVSNESLKHYLLNELKKVRGVIQYQKKNKTKLKTNKTVFDARNFEFSYPLQLDTNKITENLKKKFPECLIEFTRDKNYQNFFIKSRKKKRITSMLHYRINKKNPIIRTFSYDEIVKRTKIQKPESNIINTCLKSFLENPNENDCKVLESEFNLCITNTKILIHSEYIIASIVFNYLCCIGVESSWKSLKLFSLDSKMDVYVQGITEEATQSFRCDLVLFYNNELFIFEYKYRYDRKNSQVDVAMKCIETKEYVYRVVEFLNKNYKNFIKDTSLITSVGIGYSIKDDEINCEMKFKKESLNDYLN